MATKISLLVLVVVISFSCGCLHEELQDMQGEPDHSEDSNENLESINSRLQPPTVGSWSDPSSKDLKNYEDSTSLATPNTTWQTESTSSQKKLGWTPPEREETEEESVTRGSSHETVSTIQDFKVTTVNSD